MQISIQLQNNSSTAELANSARTQTDETLIRSIGRADRRAMETFYGRHSARVYRFVLRFTKDERLAEDVVSEVFFDVWRKAGSFRGDSQVATWLLAVARNKAIAARRQRAFAVLDDDAAAAIEDTADNPEQTLNKKDHSALLQKCLKALSPIHRDIVDLVYYQSKTIQEAATIVGVPVNTVKSRMFWARNRLEEMLREAGVVAAFA